MPVLLSLLISRSINRSELRTSYPILKFFAKVIFDNLYFFNSLDSSFDNKRLYLQFLDDILPLGSGSVDTAGQHVADPDPKH